MHIIKKIGIIGLLFTLVSCGSKIDNSDVVIPVNDVEDTNIHEWEDNLKINPELGEN